MPWPVWASLAANIALFAAKLACYLVTNSLAVAASLVDSTVVSHVSGPVGGRVKKRRGFLPDIASGFLRRPLHSFLLFTHSSSRINNLPPIPQDLVAQAVIAAANRTTRTGLDPRYPVGKARLEAVAIILCAALMAMGAG